MTDVVRSVLVVEIGSLTTRVSLIDQVEGLNRLIGQAETLTSRELPYQNVLFAVFEATAQLADLTGRTLLRDGRLLVPQTNAGDGVNAVVVAASALEPLRVVVAAIAADVSARSALHAVRGAPGVVQAVITLDDTMGRPPVTDDQSWIERQLEVILPLQPDAIVVTGGLEGGAIDAVMRLTHLINLKLMVAEASRQPLPVIIYAGNTQAQAQVQVALSDRRCELIQVANVRPTLDREVLTPLRQALLALYARQVADLPGIHQLAEADRTQLRTVVEAHYTIARFLAERLGQRALYVDTGATTTTLIATAPGTVQAAIHGARGTAYGVGALLHEVGPAAIARWLPFPIDESEVTERILHRLLRPQIMPASREECYLDLALAREALARGVAELRDEAPALAYSYLVAGGGPLRYAPHPGMALLALLDALQPGAELPGLLLRVHLDTLSLVAVCGALAGVSADAALSVFDHDLLANTPLATCVVTLGGSRVGEPVAEVELITVGGSHERVQVTYGEIARLPLPPGRFAQVKVRPAAGVRVGQAAAGEPVESDPAEVPGSLLGLVIDARGRPLRLPEDGAERRRLIWSWLHALGVEPRDSPYPEPVVEPAVPAPILTEPQPAPARASRRGWGRRGKTADQGNNGVAVAVAATDEINQSAPATDGQQIAAAPANPAPRRGWFGFGRRKS